MPSFDIISEVELHEVTNAVDQASRQVDQRFDFKGTNAKFELKETVITMSAPADFQLKQMLEILKLKLSKRGIDVACMKIDEPVTTGQTARQVVTLRQGVDAELGKKLQRLIKDSKKSGSSGMTHTVITSFTEDGYELYGKEFIRTFRQHWPESVRLVVYYEGDDTFRKLNGWEDYWRVEHIKDWFDMLTFVSSVASCRAASTTSTWMQAWRGRCSCRRMQ